MAIRASQNVGQLDERQVRVLQRADVVDERFVHVDLLVAGKGEEREVVVRVSLQGRSRVLLNIPQNGKDVDGMDASLSLLILLRVVVEGVDFRLDGRRDGRNVELSLSLREIKHASGREGRWRSRWEGI